MKLTSCLTPRERIDFHFVNCKGSCRGKQLINKSNTNGNQRASLHVHVYIVYYLGMLFTKIHVAV